MTIPRRVSAQRHARFDEDDELDIGSRRRRERPYQNPTSAGIFGFIAALSSLGLLAIVLVLFIFLQQEDQRAPNIERTRLIYYWFLILDVLSFFGGLTAVILGARASSPSNPLYRGYSLTALVLGIFELVITLGFGLWMTCAVLVVEVMRAGG